MATETRAGWRVLAAAAARPVDGASLAALRIAFGALMLVAVGRFFVHGWIREYFLEPRFFFTYWGFSWVRPWPGAGMYVHFAVLGVLALFVLVGLYTRAATLLFTLGFAYAHLIDKTNYLNHYFLVISLGLVGTSIPWARVASVDAWRARRRGRLVEQTVPAWTLWAVRLQLGLVYFFGGFAKLGSDWLLHGQPLGIWLCANGDFPLIGRWLCWPVVARAASWVAAAFDLSVPWLLSRDRTRPFAYGAVLLFHLTTARLFNIGMFPWLMMAFTPIFFSPSWPRRLLRVPLPTPTPALRARQRLGGSAALVASLLLVEALLPWRRFFYPGNLLWTEQGFRFAFAVMVMEKNGSAEFRVRDPETQKSYRVEPSEMLTPLQVRMMATQPDMILQAAQWVAAEFRRRGVYRPEVRADVYASLNGRPAARLIDPDVDLAAQRESLWNKSWILPAPTETLP